MTQIATSRILRIRRLTRRAPVEPHPAQLLRLLLLPARDPRATSTERLRAYRLLLRVLDGRLGDPKFARALHFAWINLSSAIPVGVSGGRAFGPGAPRIRRVSYGSVWR